MTANAAAAVLGAVFLGALALGPTAFAAAVVACSAVLLVDLAAALARTGPRPITIAAAIPAIALPAAIAVRPGIGWNAVPSFVAGGILAAFLAALVFGRRQEVTAALGSTAVVGCVVGLGASGLLLLRALPQGVHWTLGVVLLVAAVNAARNYSAARTKPLYAGAATVAAALIGAGALLVAAAPPFALASATGVAAVALLGVGAASVLRDAVAHDTARLVPGPGLSPAPKGRPTGVLSATALPVLLAAPAAYALARMAVL